MLKKYFVIILAVVALFVFMFLSFLAGSLHADTFDYRGVHGYYTTNETALSLGCESKDSRYTFTGIDYLLGVEITKWLDAQPSIGVAYLKNERDYSSTDESFGINGKLMFDFHKSIFYFRLGGGFMHMPINEKQQDLADSWLYGLICSDLGLRFHMKNKMEVDVGYGFQHISSPFHDGADGDYGVNTGGLVVTLKF